MTPEELMQLYAIVQYAPGKTAAQKLNFLQDLGFDVFNQPQQFVAEEFVPEAQPALRNPVADIYGRNEGYRRVFDAINNNIDPTTAVDQAVEEGVLELPMYGSDAPNPYEIAGQYAQREVENELALMNWQQRTDAERAQFMEKQGRLRQEFEQKQPLSLLDLRGQTEFEALGAPTVNDLMSLTREMERGWTANRPAPKGSTQDLVRMYGERIPRQGAAPAPKPNEGYLSRVWQNEKYTKALEKALGERIGQAQKTFVPTARSEAAFKNIALMKLLGS